MTNDEKRNVQQLAARLRRDFPNRRIVGVCVRSYVAVEVYNARADDDATICLETYDGNKLIVGADPDDGNVAIYRVVSHERGPSCSINYDHVATRRIDVPDPAAPYDDAQFATLRDAIASELEWLDGA